MKVSYSCMPNMKSRIKIHNKVVTNPQPSTQARTCKATCSWSFVHSNFLCRKLNPVCAGYLIIFWDLLVIFFAKISKVGFKKSFNSRKPFKNKVIKWKTKQTYGNISLYSQYFSPGAGSNVHKTYFYFLKLTKKYFILSS